MERIIDVDGIRLCTQATGNPADPAVLLVAGTSCSMDWWPPEFCTGLAARGLYVIRFDQRDTGRAHHDPAGEPGYTLPDLVTDAVGVLDAYGLATAHWVGFSQGGWVAQLAALDHPSRVASLVLMSTRATGHGPADADLPEVSDRLLAEWDAPPRPGLSTLEMLVAGERSLASDPFDENAVRAMVESALARATDIGASLTNHPMAGQGPRWRDRLGEIAVPTQVLHGEDDPLFPVGNGERLAKEIPNAALRTFPGLGHELPRRIWDTYQDAIVRTGRQGDTGPGQPAAGR